MTPDTVFTIANSIALFSWIYLVAAARVTPNLFRVVRLAVPVLFALVYLVALFSAERDPDGGFQTLAQVSVLFTQPWMVVAGWLHYLAFDFFVGCWILEKAKSEGIGHGWIILPMIFTFLFGPVGLLLFLILLGFRKRKTPAAKVQTA